jgi:hypothetical protein
MKYVLPIRKLIVFSQWSRKSFAIFASLGKIIKIGRVSVDISDKSLVKKTSQTRSINNALCFKKDLIELLEELQQSEGIPSTFVASFSLFMNRFVLSTPTQKEAQSVCNVLNNGQSPCFISDKAWAFLFQDFDTFLFKASHRKFMYFHHFNKF